jgi:hypothetical protein
MRTRVLDFRLSRAAQSLGACANDLPKLCGYLNEAQQMLLEAGGESGWFDTWGKVAFNVTRSNPYLTLPRHVARIINAAICKHPVRIQNSFYELLEYGVGIQPNSCVCQLREIYDRGTVPTMVDLTNTGNTKMLRFYITDQRDIDKTILVQAVDSNGTTLRSLANGVDVEGVYVRLAAPFVDSEFTLGANALSKITGFQKEVLVGDLRVYEVDTETGEQMLLSVFEPSETTPCYRRYYIGGLPSNCCPGETTVQVTAVVKFAFVPVTVDEDWLLIGNIPALKRACESIRYGEIDNPQAQAMAASKWKEAIRLLNAQLDHEFGKQMPAINFAPFGSDRLESMIGNFV